jgi:DNA repair exonuclease SbcCD ATPase subunit
MADNTAQDTAKGIQEAQQRMKELNAEIKRLGGEGFGDINALVAKFGNSLADANKQVKFMQDEVDDLKNAFSNIADTLKNVVEDINGTTKASTLLTRNFNKLEDLSRKIQQHKSNENVLSVKELKDIQTKINKEKDSLVTNLQIAKNQEAKLKEAQRLGTITKAETEELRKNLQYQDEVSKALADQEGYLGKIVKLTADEVKEEEKISKALGITGHAFKGITGFLQKIGVDSKYFDGINDKLREAAKSGSQFKVMGAGIKGIFSGIKVSVELLLLL